MVPCAQKEGSPHWPREWKSNHTSCTCTPAKSNQKERTTSALQIKSNRTNRGVEGEETTLCTCLVCWRVAAGAVADLDLLEMVGRSEPAMS